MPISFALTVGQLGINFSAALLSNRTEFLASGMTEGGHWEPSECVARQRTAIIIPFRDRRRHLHILLHYLIPVMKRQQIEFRIFVIEQVLSYFHTPVVSL